MSLELEHIWTRVQAQLTVVVDEPTHRIWLSDLHPVELVGEHLVVWRRRRPRRWIQRRFGRVIEDAVELVLGAHATVELRPAGAGDTPRPAGRRAPAQATGATPPQREPAPRDGPLGNPKLTFDQFVIGDSNRLAHAAALAVAEMPSQAYNPLFICGPPGVGKTHLLSAIANLLIAHDATIAVRVTTGEAFTNEFLGALGERRTESFKARFRDVDVLLVDDVQFLERKTRTEEEFFHTFNALHDGGRQVVFSLRPPAARPAGPRGPAPRALRVRARGRHPAAGPEHPAHDPAQARATRRHRAGRRGGPPHHRRARAEQRAHARGRADPGRRLQLAAPAAR